MSALQGEPMPSVIDATTAIREGWLGSLELVEECLARIGAHDRILNSFVHVDADGARRAAEAVDARVAAGEGELLGLEYLVEHLHQKAV